MIKDTSSRNILITALVLIILQGANLVGVAINRSDIKYNAKSSRTISDKVDMMYKDYVPMWFLEGLQQNTNYQTEEIIATMNGNAAKVKEINKKYITFQKTMLNNMAQMRGGYTSITRSVKPIEAKE